MYALRTPYLTRLLEGDMTEIEARGATVSLLQEKAPLRNPQLAERLAHACREYVDPTYVDAIIRNVAQSPMDVLHSDDDLEVLSRPGVLDTILDLGSIASTCSGLQHECELLDGYLVDDEQLEVEQDAEQDAFVDYCLELLDAHLKAFFSPFLGLSQRMETLTPTSLERCSLGFSQNGPSRGIETVCDYHALARLLMLRPSRRVSTMLRFYCMPVWAYRMGAERLCVNMPKVTRFLSKRPLGEVYLDYEGGGGGLVRRIDRARRELLVPLSSFAPDRLPLFAVPQPNTSEPIVMREHDRLTF